VYKNKINHKVKNRVVSNIIRYLDFPYSCNILSVFSIQSRSLCHLNMKTLPCRKQSGILMARYLKNKDLEHKLTSKDHISELHSYGSYYFISLQISVALPVFSLYLFRPGNDVSLLIVRHWLSGTAGQWYFGSYL